MESKLNMDKWKSWELWPFWMRYALLSPVWLWYCLKSRSMWFFTPSNPTLTFGGFEGESKKEMYEQLPEGSYPKTIYIAPHLPFSQVINKIQQAGFTYPFIVKPDIGMSGILFRKIDREEQLLEYHQMLPVEYIVQQMISYPVEYSVFYYRYPDKNKGVITGFLQKEPLSVFGNGKDTLLQLIQNHPKAKHRLEELSAWHRSNFELVIPEASRYFLSYAANLNRGAHFINLGHLVDEKLHYVFDKLNLKSGQFFYGRYDLKSTSVDDLKNGHSFSILEFNGSGAEPNHVYNSGYSYLSAAKEIIKHWKVLYQISRMNHLKGIPYWPFLKGWRFMKQSKKHFDLLKKIDTR